MPSVALDQYKKSFEEDLDALGYLKTYYDPKEHSTYTINTQHIIDATSVLKCYFETHKEHANTGLKVLEVGSGPYIGNILVASQFFDEIYPSDYNSAMLTMTKKWVKGDSPGFDYQWMVDFVTNQMQTTSTKLADQTKTKVKEFFTIDVHKENPLGEQKEFDAIITRFCIDSCSPDLESYKKAIKNVLSLLKKGGLFLQMGFFNDNDDLTKGYWDIGSKRYQDVRLPKSDIQNSVKECGMAIAEWRERIHQSSVEDAYLNTSSFTMLSVKE